MKQFIKYLFFQRLLLKTLGHNIKVMRKKTAMTQQQLSNQSGVDRTYLSGVENGKRNMSIYTLYLIAQTLKVNIKDLL